MGKREKSVCINLNQKIHKVSDHSEWKNGLVDFGANADNLSDLKRLSVATRNTIKTAITISMCINFVAVTLSVLGVLNPTTGALVHNAGSCFVVLIAALLYDRKFE